MTWDPHWDTAVRGAHAPGVGTREPGASAATRRVEVARAAAAADGDGPNLLGSAVEIVDGLAPVAAAGAARDGGRLAPAGISTLLGVEEAAPRRENPQKHGAPTIC